MDCPIRQLSVNDAMRHQLNHKRDFPGGHTAFSPERDCAKGRDGLAPGGRCVADEVKEPKAIMTGGWNSVKGFGVVGAGSGWLARPFWYGGTGVGGGLCGGRRCAGVPIPGLNTGSDDGRQSIHTC